MSRVDAKKATSQATRGWPSRREKQKGDAERITEGKRERVRSFWARSNCSGENFSPLIKSVDSNTRWTNKSYLMIYATDILSDMGARKVKKKKN